MIRVNQWIEEMTELATRSAPRRMRYSDQDPTHAVLLRNGAGEMVIAGFAHVFGYQDEKSAWAYVEMDGEDQDEASQVMMVPRGQLLPLRGAQTPKVLSDYGEDLLVKFT